MVTMYDVPYLASAGWYTEWMRLMVVEGCPPDVAAHRASVGLALKPRDYSRTLVDGAGGGVPVRLTVPLSGGASVAKRGLATDPVVSMHGDWPRVHAGALEAAYGRTPYARHFLPEVSGVTADAPDRRLRELNFMLHSIVLKTMEADSLLPEIRKVCALPCQDPVRKRVEERCARIRSVIDPEISFISVLARFGREAVFPLFPLKK